jgi:hypothetical protein
MEIIGRLPQARGTDELRAALHVARRLRPVSFRRREERLKS